MYLISHRGNLNGVESENENNPNYLKIAIDKGFNVEVDVRFEEEKFYLGHDFSQYEVNKDFLLNENIWCHAKTHSALLALDKINAHYFWHQEDDYTMTSKGFIWVYPGKPPIDNSISVLPEDFKINTSKCFGICTDYLSRYIDIK